MEPAIQPSGFVEGVVWIAQRAVAERDPSPLVVALDPVSFERPYTKELEGVSTAMKSTPPGPKGKKRLTSGYPAMTATVVNMALPVVTYANWFSYVTDFVSENREIYRSIRITRALFPDANLRFVGDSGLDDQKIPRWMDLVKAEFVIRAQHNRTVEVCSERLDRWKVELLEDLGGRCVPPPDPSCHLHPRPQGPTGEYAAGMAQDSLARYQTGTMALRRSRP
jgi:hypothetical protein